MLIHDFMNKELDGGDVASSGGSCTGVLYPAILGKRTDFVAVPIML